MRGLMSIIHKFFLIVLATGLFLGLFSITKDKPALAFDISEAFAIGAAYTTHIFFHEVGHQVVADQAGAESHNMSFFTRKNGRFYPGISSYENLPNESKLSYATGGEHMAGYTFEYALGSYREEPTTFNKALMFFSCADFVVYTLLANYASPDNETYDPNLIREELDCSKELLLSLALAKSLLNTYRIVNEDTNFIPVIMLDKKSAALALRFNF